MKRRLALIPATALAGLALFAGSASANAFTADADCDGLTVSMPRTEDGTTVTVTRNGVTARTVTVDTFGTPVFVELASPDLTVAQVWRVTVVGHNGTGTFAETVPACVTPTTTSTVAPSTTVAVTTPPVPSVPSTSVAVTTPPVPVPSTTVVTPPRATTTTVPPVYELPETGPSDWAAPIALTFVAAGFALVVAARRGGGAA